MVAGSHRRRYRTGSAMRILAVSAVLLLVVAGTTAVSASSSDSLPVSTTPDGVLNAANETSTLNESQPPFDGDFFVSGSRFESALRGPDTHETRAVVHLLRRGERNTFYYHDRIGEEFTMSTERERPREDGEPRRTMTIRLDSIRGDDDTFAKRTYPADDIPTRAELIRPNRLLRGNATYEVEEFGDPDLRAIEYSRAPRGFMFHAAGVTSHEGERVYRYGLLGKEDRPLSWLTRDVTGYALVDADGKVVHFRFGARERRGYRVLEYQPYPERTPTKPDWLATARTVPGILKNDSARRQIDAYDVPGAILLEADGEWTPEPGDRIAVHESGEDIPSKRVTLNGSTLFGPDRRVLLHTDESGAMVVSQDITAGLLPEADVSTEYNRRSRVFIDRDGLNLFRRYPDPPEYAVGEVATIRTTTLDSTSEGSGNRSSAQPVLVADGVSIPEESDKAGNVSVVVRNDDIRLRATRTPSGAEASQLLIVREEEGLRAVAAKGDDPVEGADGSFAPIEFPPDSTVTVLIDGIPVYHTTVPEEVQ